MVDAQKEPPPLISKEADERKHRLNTAGISRSAKKPNVHSLVINSI